ncbi:MAG: hypothetical protein WC637_02770 [Victivallales bacterium]
MKTLLIALLAISAILACRGGDTRKEYITIEEESKIKVYNPNAVWRTVPCSKCGGTGSKTVYKYDFKANRTFKYLEPCPYCKGSGTSGMSKM